MADKKEEVKKEVRAVKLKAKEKPTSKSDTAKEKKEEDMLFVAEVIIYNHETNRNESYDQCQSFCHKDFVKSILALREHYAILLTFHTVDDFETGGIDPKKFKSRGFSISGAEDELRLCLKGHFLTELVGACTVNVNNIYLEKDMDEDGGYDLIDDLKAKVDKAKLEALQYLFSNKKMEDPQLSMKFEGPTSAQVLPPVNKDQEGTVFGKPVTSVEQVVGQIVKETNAGKADKPVPPKGGGRKKPQTADNKTGDSK